MAISNRDIPMIEFLCQVDSEFESESFMAFLDVDSNEIDEATGCSISGLILKLLHQYKIKIKRCHSSKLESDFQTYAQENDLVYLKQ